jgi:thiol-disulfide isomerase/thioredoxin
VTKRSITFITRQGCPLCEDALPGVQRWAERLDLGLDVIDVDAEGLADRYGTTVPVVLGPDGEELLAGRWGGVRLTRMMLRARFG